MIERIAIALALIVLGVVVYRAYSRVLLRARARDSLELDRFELGRPAILYFTDPNCAPCKAIQDPALRELEARLGEQLQIITIQALERTDLANHWGVLSLPTTFIIDELGRPRRVNHGAVRTPKLVDQLKDVGALPAEAAAPEVESGI